MKTPYNQEGERVSNLLDTLGRALLRDGPRDWVDMDTAAGVCKRHGLRLNETCPSRDDLELALKTYFQRRDEFCAPGLTVDGYERRVGWDLVFQVRAYPYSAVQPSTPAPPLERSIGDPLTTAQETTPESPGKWATEKQL